MDLSEALRASVREAVSWCIRLAASADQDTALACAALACRYDCAPVCASAASAWGSQKVISMDRYSAMAADSSARAYSRRSSLAYRVPRPRWQ